MEVLKIENLFKNFGGIQALNNVSISMEAGKKLAIIGPNGAGKTTLFNVLSGLLYATAGRIYLFGQDITRMPPQQRAHLGLARSFQITRLLFNLTVLENIMLAIQGTQPYRYSFFRPITGYKHLLIKAQELLESINLWGKRNEIVKNIGYGEQRKMELVLSLASEPKLLLLDEPGTGLTTTERADMVKTIRTLRSSITTLIVDHDMDLVFSIADRMIVLHYGEKIAEGTPDEIRRDSKVKEIYLGVDGGSGIARVS